MLRLFPGVVCGLRRQLGGGRRSGGQRGVRVEPLDVFQEIRLPLCLQLAVGTFDELGEVNFSNVIPEVEREYFLKFTLLQ